MKKRKLKRLLKEALRQLAELRAPAAAGPALSTWLSTYRTVLGQRGYHPQTIKNRANSIKHIEAVLGDRPLRMIKPHEIAEKLRLFTPATAGRLLGELRDIYTEAIANGAAENNPAAHIKAPRHRGLRKRLHLDVWQSMRTLSQASPQRWVEAMLLLALATGQRRADLAKMRFDDIVDDHLRIEQQKKAGKPIGARLAIPLSLRLEATGLTLGQVVEVCRRAGKPGPTLLRKAGGGPIEMSSLSARFHEHIVTILGPEAHPRYEWPSLHEVRSLSARTYIAEGMPPDQVQTLLGHKHAEMTAIYLDDRGLSASDWKSWRRRLGRIITRRPDLMAEPTIPTSAGVVALGVALISPAAGAYVAIVACSLAGALWALAAASTERKRDGVWLLLRLVLTATVLTVSVSALIEQRYGLPARDVLPGVAFVLGMGPERWRAVITAVADLRRRLGQPPAGGSDGSQQ